MVLLSEMGKTGGETDLSGKSVGDKLSLRGLTDIQGRCRAGSERSGLGMQMWVVTMKPVFTAVRVNVVKKKKQQTQGRAMGSSSI